MTATRSSEALAERIAERERAVTEFFEAESGRLALACHAMAKRFSRGGTLIASGTGPAATDAAHAAVEFMHPVIVGKRALPAIAPTNDPTGASTAARLAHPDDIALAISQRPHDPEIAALVAGFRDAGLLTIVLAPTAEPDADYSFAVPGEDPAVIQEVEETAYHVLWELVHVFFEHPGLLDDACITCGDVAVRAEVVAVGESTAVIEKEGAREEIATDLVEGVQVGDSLLCHAGVAIERVDRGAGDASFLYPFLERSETDLEAVLADVEDSTLRKARQVTELRGRIDTGAIESCGAVLRERVAAGGRLIAFGNGGSATDAQDMAADALDRGLRALALGNDSATVTAVANDVGFDNVFSRQLIALGRSSDIAVAISTSGSSPNLVAALEEAHRRQMLTVGIAGYDGGRLAGLDWLDHLFVVRSEDIPRIQEAQATIYHLLLEAAGSR